MNVITDYSLLKISGIDAKKFLQGQLTCDIEKITTEQSCLGAHCNPQGRIISLFTIFLYNNDYYLLMPHDMAPIAMAALKKYAVFYKVTLDALPADKTIIPTSIVFNKSKNISAGIPSIYPETSGKFLPHELNLHQLNAISFDKGCYTGQEIIARMHYRGKLKKHLYRASIINTIPPVPGSDIYYQSNLETQTGGIIVDSSPEISDNRIQLLLVCDEINAKNDHMFIEEDNRIYLQFLE